MNKNHWDRKVLDLMENIKLVPNVAFQYVHEIRKLVSAIKLGWSWLDRVMQYKKAWEREEVEEKLTPTGKRANELKKIYENVHKELKFQTSEDFESKTLLTLIYQCWLSRGQPLQHLQVLHETNGSDNEVFGTWGEHKSRSPSSGGHLHLPRIPASWWT